MKNKLIFIALHSLIWLITIFNVIIFLIAELTRYISEETDDLLGMLAQKRDKFYFKQKVVKNDKRSEDTDY